MSYPPNCLPYTDDCFEMGILFLDAVYIFIHLKTHVPLVESNDRTRQCGF